MGKISQAYYYYIIPGYLCLLLYVVPTAASHYLTILFACLSLILVLLDAATTLRQKKLFDKRSFLFLFSFVLSCLFLFLHFSNYSSGIVYALYILLIYWAYFFKKKPAIEPNHFKAFITVAVYLCSLFAIFYSALYKFTSVSFGFAVVPGSTDSNIGSFYLILLLSFCLMTKRFIPSILLATSIYFSGSRLGLISCLFLIVCFFLIYFTKPRNYSFSFPFVLLSFSFSIFFMAIFSFFWKDFIFANGYGSYRSGINDSSNASRFVSNVFWINTIFENPIAGFFGYGNHLLTDFGINIYNATSSLYWFGQRIVQPHFTFLNMLIKYGVCFTVSYYVLLSFMISKKLNTYTLPIFIIVIISGLILHSTLVEEGLLLFFLVLEYSRSNHPILYNEKCGNIYKQITI